MATDPRGELTSLEEKLVACLVREAGPCGRHVAAAVASAAIRAVTRQPDEAALDGEIIKRATTVAKGIAFQNALSDGEKVPPLAAAVRVAHSQRRGQQGQSRLGAQPLLLPSRGEPPGVHRGGEACPRH